MLQGCATGGSAGRAYVKAISAMKAPTRYGVNATSLLNTAQLENLVRFLKKKLNRA